MLIILIWAPDPAIRSKSSPGEHHLQILKITCRAVGFPLLSGADMGVSVGVGVAEDSILHQQMFNTTYRTVGFPLLSGARKWVGESV